MLAAARAAIRRETSRAAAIYLQGPTEHSHGIASSLLSNTAVRAGEITKALVKGLVRDIDAPRAPALTAAAPV
ncbi:hypothetical protein SBADM41S_01080 [Streptomyces badius]